MIDLYYWTTPNCHKITMFLEEADVAYEIKPVNISTGEQFRPAFLAISPNNRIPAIVDHAPQRGEDPIQIFESGAILQYLAEKTGQFLSPDLRTRFAALQWLYWQVGGLGPMAGQNHHFCQYATEKLPNAIERFVKETNRLYGVLDRRLSHRAFLAGGYSIADMACYPWVLLHARQRQRLEDFANVKRWLEAIESRPATMRAYERASQINVRPTVDESPKKHAFGQTAAGPAKTASA